METAAFNIDGRTDEKSVETIRNSVLSISGVFDTDIDLANNRIYVTYDPETIDIPVIKSAVEAIGFSER